MKKKIIALAAMSAILITTYLILSNKAEAPGSDKGDLAGNKDSSIPVEDLSKYTVDVQESIYVIVNKKRPISTSYIPQNLVRPSIELIPEDNPEEQQLRSEAGNAAEEMFNAAKNEELSLVMASGYRSANLQQTYYDNYVARDGQAAADKYSARPGTSEHQTGLSMDITASDRQCYLEICFADTAEGKWLKNNAYKYGFHLRYQNGKENLTGYQFEPWHFRYVGQDLAERLFDSGQTMEEFFGI